MASENSCYRENFAKLSNASSPEFHTPHYPWGWWNRSIPLMLKRFIAVNGKSWKPSSRWRLWLLVEQKHLLWGKGWRRTVLGNQPRADKGISIDILMQKIVRPASERSFGRHKQSKEAKAKKAKTVCWQVEKDWEVNDFGEGCPMLQNSTSGWTPVLKGTM